MHTLWLPRTFWEDHDERDLPAGDVVKKTKNRVLIQCDDETLAEIESDADYYGDPTGAPDWEDGAAIRASARRTIVAIKKYRAKVAA